MISTDELIKLGEECGLTFDGTFDDEGRPDFVGKRENWRKYDELLDNVDWSEN